MSKFTSKDLMNAMGLKVGNKIEMSDFHGDIYEVIDKVRKYTINDIEKEITDYWLRYTKNEKILLPITVLLDADFTILPRYTLTEDEKAIVRHIGKNFNWLCRDMYVLYLKYNGIKEQYVLPLNNDLFQFVSISTPVSIDELRKCL